MRALCIPLAGPMQSWGTRSRFSDRDCEHTPTKSGVVGLIASAMGLARDADLSAFKRLSFGVRCEREGTIRRDFHTTLDVVKADGKVDKNPQISDRYYLADAVFVAVICGDAGLLGEVSDALRRPTWQPYLGRRSYVPSVLPYDPSGPFDAESPREALLSRPLIIGQGDESVIRLEYDSDSPGGTMRRDDPVCFSIRRRDYAPRRVATEFLPARSFPAGTFFKEANRVS